MKLNFKIATLIILCSTIPAISVLSYTLFTISNNNKQSAIADVGHKVKMSATLLSNELVSAQREVELYAQLPLLKSMDPIRFIPFLQTELSRHNADERRYEKFIIGDLEGHFYNTAGGNAHQGMKRTFNDKDPNSLPKSIVKRDYWQATINPLNETSQVNAAFISSPMISYTTRARQVVIASPIINQSQIVGMIGVSIDWERIITLIKSVQNSQFNNFYWSPKLFLVSKDGTYWYHWKNSRIAAIEADDNGAPILDELGQYKTKTYTLEDDGIPRSIADSTAYQNTLTTPFIDKQGHESYIFTYPIGETSYKLGLVITENELTPDIINFKKIIFIFIASTLAALFAGLSWNRYNVIRPLKSILLYVHKLKDGKYSAALPLPTSNEFGLVGNTLKEMSKAIRQREASLKESESRFEYAMAGTNDGLWDWDIVNNTMYYSPRWYEMLGYNHEELPATLETFTQLVHPDEVDYCQQYIQDFLEQKQSHFQLTFCMQHKEGHDVHILSRAFLITDKSGQKPLRLIGTHVDITEQKRYERAIKKLNLELESRVEERTNALKKANEKLKSLSLHDALTGVENRRAMDLALTHAHKLFSSRVRLYSILLIDIDWFKRYNDHYGHQEGDHVLKEVAQLLVQSIRYEDRLYRYGGEEFLVLMSDTNEKLAQLVGMRIIDNIQKAQIEHTQSPLKYISTSIGVTTVKIGDDEWHAVLKRADINLYDAKAQGRSQLVSR